MRLKDMDAKSVSKRTEIISKIWEEHKKALFPKGLGGKEIDGIDLALLDSDIAGCAETFFKRTNNYNLDVCRTAILGLCYRDLSIVCKQLHGSEQEYFLKLESLAHLILEMIRDKNKEL